MGFEFYAEHSLSKWPEYHSVLHELRDEHGNQMLTMHIDVDPLRFNVSVMKRMEREFAALRQCTDATIFAIEDHPDDAKWERFVRRMGFEFSSRVECTDGRSRRCFVSKKKNNEHDKHSNVPAVVPAVVGAAAVPSAGVRTGVN
jgi:hypothetical protein